MRRSIIWSLAVLLSVVTAVPRASAQTSHAAPQSALDAVLQQHAAESDADRAAVLRVLEHPDVKAVADSMGVDLRRAARAVATLGADEVRDLAAQARQVERALEGGQSRVVISTTVIIIALLVLILIIVAVD